MKKYSSIQFWLNKSFCKNDGLKINLKWLIATNFPFDLSLEDNKDSESESFMRIFLKAFADSSDRNSDIRDIFSVMPENGIHKTSWQKLKTSL